MDWKVYNQQGKVVNTVELDKKIFQGEINQPILREAVLAHQANCRQGTASTKNRGAVRGGGRKPWIQKGTGRARAGSTRSPVWVGGGVAFGPNPRDFHYRLTRKKKKMALISALRMKIREGGFFILDEMSISSGKTKEMSALLGSLSLSGKTLLVLGEPDEKTLRSSSNLSYLALQSPLLVSAFETLFYDNFLLTKEALAILSERLKNE